MTIDRFNTLNLLDSSVSEYTIDGRGWNESCDDIVLPGIGWISLTGAGTCKVRVQMCGELQSHRREPIMPYDGRMNLHRFTGSHKTT